MYTLEVETKNGIQKENIYEIHELTYLDKLMDSKDSKKRGINYIGIPCAFDIETTNIYEKDENGKPKKEPRPYAFMYHWQFCFVDQVVFGRRWEDFQKLLKALEVNLNLSSKNRLVVWVHNLPFEWQFMRDFIEYEDGFFRDDRAPLRVYTKGGIEFRCSYALSNMSLQKFCENEVGVIHYKLVDTYDYEKIRTPLTPMTTEELAYCYNDVRGLCECIESRLKDDTLATIPMTSTGYVRRELRSNVKKNKKNREIFLNSALDPKLYTMCRDAFRGGDTHANSDRADQLCHNVWSYDIKSSYPTAILEFDRYPISAFAKMNVSTYMNNDVSEYALLMTVRFKNIKYNYKSDVFCGIPYIALAKCSKWTPDKIVDNGRIVFASGLEMTITNLDLEIIQKEYVYDEFYIGEIYASRGGKLCKEVRETTLDYFRRKTLLDGDPEHEYEYMKAKNRLNSIYGCMVMRIDQTLVKWDNNKKEYYSEENTLEEQLAKFYKSYNSFLSYQHGLFITNFARLRLREMLWTVGKDVIYCDTDSIKGVGEHDAEFEAKNKELKALAEECGAYADNKEGERFYLGVWENETKKKGRYEEFKTLGAKKYVYKQGEKIKSTIAGVNKKAGAEYFTKHGVDGLCTGAVITNSGHLTAYYNDDKIHKLTIGNCTFTTASNVALVNNTYKIGVTEEYYDILLKGIANIYDID